MQTAAQSQAVSSSQQAAAHSATQFDTITYVTPPGAGSRRKPKAGTSDKISAKDMASLPVEVLDQAIENMDGTQFNLVVRSGIADAELAEVVEEITGVATTAKPPGLDKDQVLSNLEKEKTRRLEEGEIPMRSLVISKVFHV